ncbi:MAG: ABC transporter permease [Propionibacteriaceae bacterium]|jgi:peptide/nickel transport system permease protein|nr:ABC transporter permease [Propionibacteriaceae bacterium]
MPVLRAAARRFAIFIGTVLVASVVIFLLVQALPGDVAQATLGMGASPEAVETLRQRWGLNQPLVTRYLQWITGMMTGDFGASYATGASVLSQIAPCLAVTGWLVGLSIPLSLLVSLPLGMVAAMMRRRPLGVIVNAGSHVGLAIPVFFAGTVASIIFAVKLSWLPANGYVPASVSASGWLEHIILPVAAIVLAQSCFLGRYVRAGFIDVLSEDYYRTARAVGWTKWRGLLRHGLRNMATSLATVVGMQVASLLVGAVLVEQVFVLPGLGRLLIQAVAAHDLMVVQAVVMLLVFTVLAVNFLIDVAYLAIDPRLVSARGGRA